MSVARMRRALLLAAAAACAACASCVPASEPAEPAGAIGFRTEPSAATRGEPFVTADGWTLTVSMLAFEVNVQSYGASVRLYARSESYRFRASESAEIFTREIPPGPASVHLTLQGGFLRRSDFDDSVQNLDLPDAVVARFLRPADADTFPPSYSGGRNGPTMVLVMRAERAGRAITIDLSVGTLSLSGTRVAWTAAGEVRADALAAARLRVRAEALFTDPQSGALLFDEFAAADGNADGSLDAAELLVASPCAPEDVSGPCSANDGPLGSGALGSLADARSTRLIDRISSRVRGLFEFAR